MQSDAPALQETFAIGTSDRILVTGDQNISDQEIYFNIEEYLPLYWLTGYNDLIVTSI